MADSRIHHGVDLVEVGRIERMIDSHGAAFTDRVFTEGERAYSELGKRRRAERYAVRFACKEAVLKALGTGWRQGISWQDVEVLRDANGAPGVRLAGRCVELAASRSIEHWAVSLSHTDSHAMASVIGYGTGG